MKYIHACGFIAILAWGVGCHSAAKKDLPTQPAPAANRSAAAHPKLIKTIGNPGYGNVQCGIQDKAGNLWFGTTENGLYKYDGKSFQQFLIADGLNSNNIYCLLQDTSGKIWIGTGAGLCIYNPLALPGTEGKIFSEIKIPLPKNLPPNRNPYYRNSHWVYHIIQAKSGKLWLATIDGVFVYDGRSFNRFAINKAAGFLSSNDNAERILEDKEGNIWFGGRTNGGVYRYDGKSITNLALPELFQDGPTPKPHNWGWPQWQDTNGNIWFSNWGGAYRYDGKSFTAFTKKDGLPGIVTRIIQDKKGNIWAGGDGICRYDGKSFTCFTPKEGLAHPGVWSIVEDTSGNFWVGTRETGLYLFDGKNFTAYSEYKEQPLAH